MANKVKVDWDYVGKLEDELISYIKETFKNHEEIQTTIEMCKKYNILLPGIDFRMRIGCAYHTLEYERLSKFKKVLGKRNIDKMILESVINSGGISNVGTTMCTCATTFKYTASNTVAIPSVRVYIDYAKWMMQLFMNPGRHDDVMTDAKLAVRHEFGHVADFISFIGRDYDEYETECHRRDELAKVAKKEYDKYGKLISEAEDLKTCKELSRKKMYAYYELDPYEVMANKYAHFTDEEFEQLCYNGLGLTSYY